jgi:hypothetical protein
LLAGTGDELVAAALGCVARRELVRLDANEDWRRSGMAREKTTWTHRGKERRWWWRTS